MPFFIFVIYWGGGFVFEMRSYYVAQVGLELMVIFLPQWRWACTITPDFRSSSLGRSEDERGRPHGKATADPEFPAAQTSYYQKEK